MINERFHTICSDQFSTASGFWKHECGFRFCFTCFSISSCWSSSGALCVSNVMYPIDPTTLSKWSYFTHLHFSLAIDSRSDMTMLMCSSLKVELFSTVSCLNPRTTFLVMSLTCPSPSTIFIAMRSALFRASINSMNANRWLKLCHD